MKTDIWQGCYPSKWKSNITQESMTHPAKFSSRLIKRIYQHMQAEGWIKPNDSAIDPFGGVALGAQDAMFLGLNWVGVELEQKFVDLGNQNIALWKKKYSILERLGTAILLQGDSRHLLEVLNDNFHASISSPPYADSLNTSECGSGIDYSKAKQGGKKMTAVREAIATGYGSSEGQLGIMKNRGITAAISSPPYLQSEGGFNPEKTKLGRGDPNLLQRHAAGNKASNAYGKSEGQLSSMNDKGFDAAISSPPFSVALTGGGIAKQGYCNNKKRKASEEKPFDLVGKRSYMPENQGNSNGQLASMNDKGFDLALSLPPYVSGGHHADQTGAWGEKSQSVPKDLAEYGNSDGQMGKMQANNFDVAVSSPPYAEARVGKESGQEHAGRGDQYGNADGQIGGADDFWLSARTIIEQVYAVLSPSGHAVWIIKDYVKNREIVPFTDQWRQLCEAVGFKILHIHHAALVNHKGTQYTLDGGTVEHKTESKSFFRRVVESKGSPRIDFEVVLCMEKGKQHG